MLTLTKNKLLVIAVSAIVFFAWLNRIEYLFDCKITTGQVIGTKIWGINGSSSAPIVKFQTVPVQENPNIAAITFQGEKNLEHYVNETVPVIYKKTDPEKASIYTFFGFWFPSLIWTVIPLAFACAAILAFIGDKDRIVVSLKTLSFKREKETDLEIIEKASGDDEKHIRELN